MADKQFADGMIVKKPHEKAPDFVIAGVSFKVDEFKQLLEDHGLDGWLNVQIKESKGGKYYAEIDTWKKEERPTPDVINSDLDVLADDPDLPF